MITFSVEYYLYQTIAFGGFVQKKNKLRNSVQIDAMEPIQKFQWSIRILRIFFRIIFQDILEPNYRGGIGFYAIALLWFLTNVCYFFTIVDNVHYDVEIRFNCAAMICGTLQLFLKYVFMQNLRQLIPITEFIEDIYVKNAQPTGRYYAICAQYGRISQLTIKVGASLYFTSIGIITLSGIFETIITGVVKPTMALFFPFVFEYSKIMWWTLMAFNYLMSAICFFTTPPGDMLFFVIFANIPMIPAVIEGQLDELTETIEKQTVRRGEIKYRLLQYIWMQRNYYEYGGDI